MRYSKLLEMLDLTCSVILHKNNSFGEKPDSTDDVKVFIA